MGQADPSRKTSPRGRDASAAAGVSSNGTDPRDTSWARIVLPVHASGRPMRVEFRDAGTSDRYGGYIDAVSLEAR